MEEIRNIDRKISQIWIKESREVMIGENANKNIRNDQKFQRCIWQDLAAGFLSLSWEEFYHCTVLLT